MKHLALTLLVWYQQQQRQEAAGEASTSNELDQEGPEESNVTLSQLTADMGGGADEDDVEDEEVRRETID